MASAGTWASACVHTCVHTHMPCMYNQSLVISLGLEEATESHKNGKEGAEDVVQRRTAFLHTQGPAFLRHRIRLRIDLHGRAGEVVPHRFPPSFCHYLQVGDHCCDRITTSLFILFTLCVCVCIPATVHLWRSEIKLTESVLSFYYVVPGNRTQVVRFGSRRLSHLASLRSQLYNHLLGGQFFS